MLGLRFAGCDDVVLFQPATNTDLAETGSPRKAGKDVVLAKPVYTGLIPVGMTRLRMILHGTWT